MKNKEIDKETTRFRELLLTASMIEADNTFLKRVLCQILLTHGGSIMCNPALAEAADEALKTHVLSFGSGEVSLEIGD